MKHIIPLLLGATLVGCAGQAPNPTQPVLVSEEPKPEWVTEHKLEDSTTMYFTGVSTKYAEERKALKDAKYDALSRFLDYCGLHTKLHEKYISHVNGSTANVLATTNKIETQLETNSEAQVGQFRVIKKHMEVYNGTRGKFYKMYVLASVPKNEVGRVKAWQKENNLQKIAKLKSLNNQQSNLIQETKMELENVQNELESALEIIKQKDFLDALFGEANGDPKIAGEIAGYSHYTVPLKALKEEIIDRAEQVLAAFAPKASMQVINTIHLLMKMFIQH